VDRSAALKKYARVYALVIAGSFIYALTFNWFFQPNHIAFGGFTGVAQILNALIPALPVGVVTIAMNVPLFILGVRRMGIGILFSSLFAMAAGSATVDVMASLYTFEAMDPLLASIYGGVLLGVSLGLMLLVDTTTGGTELLARLLKFHFHHLSMGRLCLIIDLVVISAYAAIFRNLNNALYGIVALYISTLVMDMLIYGSRNAELTYIISDESEQIAKAILDMEMGVTVLDGKGAYTGNSKKVLLCAVKRRNIAAVKAQVMAIDPNAFMIVSQAHEVLGEGFDIYNKDSM